VDAQININHICSKDSRQTPFFFLPEFAIKELIIKLDLTQDWELVAERLEFSTEQILHWKDRGGAKCLLRECYGGTVYLEDFIAAVGHVGNQPAISLLQQVYPEVRKVFENEVRERNTDLQHLTVDYYALSVDSPSPPHITSDHSQSTHSNTSDHGQSSPRNTSEPRQLAASDPGDEVRRRPVPSRSSDPLRWTVCPPLSSQDHKEIERSLLHLSLRGHGSLPSRGSSGQEGSVLREGGLTSSVRVKPKGVWDSRVGEEETERVGSERVGAASKLQHAQSVQTSMQRVPFSQGQRHVQVFLTYSSHTKRQMKPVFNLFNCLRDNQFSVSHEESDSHRLAQDRLGWLDQRFRSVDYILVLITPEYLEDVSCVHSDPGGADPSPLLIVDPTDRALNARYIYKLMQAEYFLNHCVNKRFIPVIMPASKDSSNQAAPRDRNLVPHWLKCGCVYWWPKDYRDLFWYMINAKNVIRNFIMDKSTNEQTITISRT